MTTHRQALYPLKFEPIYKSKVWGGRVIEQLGRVLPGDEDDRIGESWELADLGQTSASGGGGGQERSKITNGPLAGQTLQDVIQRYGNDLLGRLHLSPQGGFPLLVKFLDARENLSVQVHPSPAYATKHPDAHLKSEAWYIVDAQPGAVIYKGVREGVTPQRFRDAIGSGGLEDLMISVPAKPGDCHYLPSGTCHALGAGILVAEVQTPSDTTFRVYDWGRTERQLHVDQALECIQFRPPDVTHEEKRSHIAGMFTTVTRLVSCDHFRIEKVRMSEGYEQEIPYDQPAVWVVLQGAGRITPPPSASPGIPGGRCDSPWPAVDFQSGQTLLVPAGLNDAHVRLDQDTVWLEITFPQASAQLFA